MNWQKLKDEYGESKAEHFDDPNAYIRYLESKGQKHEANRVRREMNRREEREDEEGLGRMWEETDG